MRYLVTICVFLYCNLCSAFTFYDGSTYTTSKPADWTTYIESTVSIQDGPDFTYVDGSSLNAPTAASANNNADTCAAANASYCVIDIETWATDSSSGRATTKSQAETTIGYYNARQPTLQLGWFGYIPILDYSRAILGEANASYQAWQAENNQISFCSSVDAVFPELYVPVYEDRPYTNTLAFIEAQLKEAHRVCPSANLLPFLWPMYKETVTTVRNNITNISAANPAVVTTSGTNNIQTGMQVYFTDLTGSDELEKTYRRVTRINSTTFSIDGIDGSSITAYGSGGRIIAAIPGYLWTQILNLVDEYTEGAVIWNNGYKWDSNLDWWQITKARKNRLDNLEPGYSFMQKNADRRN